LTERKSVSITQNQLEWVASNNITNDSNKPIITFLSIFIMLQIIHTWMWRLRIKKNNSFQYQYFFFNFDIKMFWRYRYLQFQRERIKNKIYARLSLLSKCAIIVNVLNTFMLLNLFFSSEKWQWNIIVWAYNECTTSYLIYFLLY